MTTLTSKAVKKQLLVSKTNALRSLNLEKALEYDLNKFFQNLKTQVLAALYEYYPMDEQGILLQGQADLILAPIFESQKEYYEILERYNKKEYRSGVRQAKRLVKLAKANVSARKSENTTTFNANKLVKIEKDDLFGTNDWTEEKLLKQSFTASEHTMNRVDRDINKILSDGYASGAGIKKVASDIEKRFNQLKTWESRRIARTEIHNAHEMGAMNTYYEMGVEYTQWSAAHDPRTRTSHRELDGEIIPLGGTYSNGCQYPGDTKGPLKEWINCRCGNLPFIMPYGYIAPPGKSQFRESDIMPTLDLYNEDILNEQNNLSKDINLIKQKFSNTQWDEVLEKLDKPKKKKQYVQTNTLKNNFSGNSKIKIKMKDDNLSEEDILRIYNNVDDNLKQFITEIEVLPEKKLSNNRWRAGRIKQNTTKMKLYYIPHFSDSDYLNVFYHEIAHSLDYISGPEIYNISNSELWKEIFKLDKKYNINNKKIQDNEYYVNEYALSKSNKYKGKQPDRIYAEDFAESVRLYFAKDPYFEKHFKFRYEFLKLLFGEV